MEVPRRYADPRPKGAATGRFRALLRGVPVPKCRIIGIIVHYRMMVTTFSLQCPARFHQGAGYEHSTDGFRPAQTSRANAPGGPHGADGFRPAPPPRADAAGSPVRHRLGSRSQAGGTRCTSRRAAARQPSGAGSGVCDQPPRARAGPGAHHDQSGRRLLRLAQEVVRGLKQASGSFAGSAVRHGAPALCGRSGAALQAP